MKKTLFALCATLACAASFAQPMAGQLNFDSPELPRARAECARTVGVQELRDYHRCMTQKGFGREVRAERGQQMREERREDRRTDRQEERRDGRRAQEFSDRYNARQAGPHDGPQGAWQDRGEQPDHVGRASRQEQQRQEEGRQPYGMNSGPDRRNGAGAPQVRRIGAAECQAMTGGRPGIASFDACMNANAPTQSAPPAEAPPVLWQKPAALR